MLFIFKSYKKSKWKKKTDGILWKESVIKNGLLSCEQMQV